MKVFFSTKAGMVSLVLFVLLMGYMVQRVVARSLLREKAEVEAGALGTPDLAAKESPAKNKEPSGAKAPQLTAPGKPLPLLDATEQENLSYLERSKALSGQSRVDRDRQGRYVTRRKTASPQSDSRVSSESAETAKPGLGLRLGGKAAIAGKAGIPELADAASFAETSSSGAHQEPSIDDAWNKEAMLRFCPYGRPIKCELVFTIDSTMEETPLVGLVMEPVYNNGYLVIPAGTELHGLARPDRLRDRLFSGTEWMMILPREEAAPNGRQMAVKGLALDRAQTDDNGLTWGITDGSTGLQGAVIRTLEMEELKQFAATFLSAAAAGLEQRESDGRGRTRVVATPANAALQGVSKLMEETAQKIAAEVQKHGVFLRVPGGKPFYFYPQQAIQALEAALPGAAKAGRAPARRQTERSGG